jgi:plasmid maintenance system antidote protein VapI
MTPTNRVTTHPGEKILRRKFLGPLGLTVRTRVA